MYGKEIVIIACITPLGIYGSDETGKPSIPWHSRLDMNHFKKETTGHTLVIGLKTYESLQGRKLPNRDIIVVTSNKFLQDDGVTFCSSLEEAIKKAKTKKVFIGGGAGLWTLALSFADELLITIIEVPISETNRTVVCKELVCPTSKYPNFHLVSEVSTGEAHGGVYVKLTFRKYIKIKSPGRVWWSAGGRKIKFEEKN